MLQRSFFVLAQGNKGVKTPPLNDPLKASLSLPVGGLRSFRKDWQTKKCSMKRALREKFKQKTKLGGLLRDTGKKTLIECNKYDSYWGNGRHIYDRNARHGIGQNRLGKLLEEVREMVN